MNLRGPPLWLVCDVFCWLGVLVSFISFVTAFAGAAMRMTAQKRRRLEPAELASLARLQAEQEAWLGYAIARRVFRLAGIRARVRFEKVSPARTLWAMKHRASQTLRDTTHLDRITRRRAQRLKRLMATPPVSLPRAGEGPRSLLDRHANSGGGPSSLRATGPAPIAVPVPHPTAPPETSAPASLPRSGEEARARLIPLLHPVTRLRAGLRVRAPPWRALTAQKQTTRALLKHQRGRGRLCSPRRAVASAQKPKQKGRPLRGGLSGIRWASP